MKKLHHSMYKPLESSMLTHLKKCCFSHQLRVTFHIRRVWKTTRRTPRWTSRCKTLDKGCASQIHQIKIRWKWLKGISLIILSNHDKRYKWLPISACRMQAINKLQETLCLNKTESWPLMSLIVRIQTWSHSKVQIFSQCLFHFKKIRTETFQTWRKEMVDLGSTLVRRVRISRI